MAVKRMRDVGAGILMVGLAGWSLCGMMAWGELVPVLVIVAGCVLFCVGVTKWGSDR